MREFEELAGHRFFEAVDARDAIADGNDIAHFADIDTAAIFLDLLADDFCNLVCFDFHRAP